MDPGLQPERTALAWSRTAVGLLANALIALRAAHTDGSRTLAALAVSLVVAAGATLVVAAWRRWHLEGWPHAPPVIVLRLVATVVLIACVTGSCAMVGHLCVDADRGGAEAEKSRNRIWLRVYPMGHNVAGGIRENGH